MNFLHTSNYKILRLSLNNKSTNNLQIQIKKTIFDHCIPWKDWIYFSAFSKYAIATSRVFWFCIYIVVSTVIFTACSGFLWSSYHQNSWETSEKERYVSNVKELMKLEGESMMCCLICLTGSSVSFAMIAPTAYFYPVRNFTIEISVWGVVGILDPCQSKYNPNQNAFRPDNVVLPAQLS